MHTCYVATVQGQTGSHGIRADGRMYVEPLDVWHAFILRWGDPRMLPAASHTMCRTACCTMGKSWLPYILSAHKAGRVPILTFRLYNRASFYACGPLLKATWLLPSHSHLDIQVREPDWLHFPYTCGEDKLEHWHIKVSRETFSEGESGVGWGRGVE